MASWNLLAQLKQSHSCFIVLLGFFLSKCDMLLLHCKSQTSRGQRHTQFVGRLSQMISTMIDSQFCFLHLNQFFFLKKNLRFIRGNRVTQELIPIGILFNFWWGQLLFFFSAVGKH